MAPSSDPDQVRELHVPMPTHRTTLAPDASAGVPRRCRIWTTADANIREMTLHQGSSTSHRRNQPNRSCIQSWRRVFGSRNREGAGRHEARRARNGRASRSVPSCIFAPSWSRLPALFTSPAGNGAWPEVHKPAARRCHPVLTHIKTVDSTSS